MNALPSCGDIWLVNLEPTEGHEPDDMRPCLIISDDDLNHGPAELVIILPLASQSHGIPLRHPVEPPEGGLTEKRYLMPEMIRSISTRRLFKRLGTVEPATLAIVQNYVKVLLHL